MPLRSARFSAVTAALRAAALLLFGVHAVAQETAQVASQTVKFSRTTVPNQRARLPNLRQVIGLRDADVFGLQATAGIPAPSPLLPAVGGSVAIDDDGIGIVLNGARSPRERRLAERGAILSTMHKYGLLIRTRGDQ